MIVVWEDLFVLRSPLGDLDFNVVDPETGFLFLLVPQACKHSMPMRSVSDSIPQDDGEIHHRRFRGGMAVQLTVQLAIAQDGWELGNDADPACGSDAQLMADLFYSHVVAMQNDQDGRLLWTPGSLSAGDELDQRLIDSFRPRDLSDPVLDTGGITTLTTIFDTPFPYAISAAQTTPAIGGGITNAGNAPFCPVLHIDGPSSAFIVANDTTGEGIVYDSSRIGGVALGGGDYAEIDCFRRTITLNGDVSFLDAGLDPLLSQFFKMAPGVNDLEITGATGTVLMNDAFV